MQNSHAPSLSNGLPCHANHWQRSQAEIIIDSYQHWTGQSLLTTPGSDLARRLFEAPFAVVSHGTEQDPIFNYGNQLALQLFELSWPAFTRMPSRLSAEQPNREQRNKILQQVAQQGITRDYSGIRISSTGKRFRIHQGSIWNLLDEGGGVCGQSACFVVLPG